MDNKLSELKVRIPADKKSRESVAAGYVTDNNSGGYFVIECQECGAVYPSQHADGGGQIADTGDYNDAICPHCGEEGPEECENVGLAWNVQQAKIIALLAELEAKDQALNNITELWKDANATAFERIRELKEELEAKDKRIAELENDEIRQRLANAEHQLHMAELRAHNARAGRIAQFRKRKAAEKRLATPVRLPEGLAQKIKVTGYYEALNEMMDCVRAAGFTVDGDA